MLCFENGLIPLRISCFEYKIPTKDIFLLVLYFSTDKENSIIVENKNTAMSFIMHYETWSFPLFVTNYPKRIIFEKKKKKWGKRDHDRVFCPIIFSRYYYYSNSISDIRIISNFNEILTKYTGDNFSYYVYPTETIFLLTIE